VRAPELVQTPAKRLRYPESSLIRCAPAPSRGAKPVRICGHRVPVCFKGLPGNPAKAEIASMLPGFRFLLAAIVLSMSVLVFGLGAAALLRAAHDEFASNASLRVALEAKFAQRDEAASDASGQVETPVLAILRVEPEPAQREAAEIIPEAAAPAEPAAIAAAPDEPGKIAALTPAASAPLEPGEPESPAGETSVQSEAPVAPAPAPAETAGIAAAEQLLPTATETAEPAIAPSAPNAGIAVTNVATLGGLPVAIETSPPAKAASARPDPDAARKRLQARRAKERRRAALRARQAAAAQQQAADPFAQPTITTRRR
jgi:hypothetical protein